MQDYQDWLAELEEELWVRLGAEIDEFNDTDFQTLFDSGHSPSTVVEMLYEDDYERFDEEDEVIDDDD